MLVLPDSDLRTTLPAIGMLLNVPSHLLSSTLILSGQKMTILAAEMHQHLSGLSLTFVVVSKAHGMLLLTGASEMRYVAPVHCSTHLGLFKTLAK